MDTQTEVLDQETFFKELEETPVDLHLERRSELGKTLKLDVGQPKEKVFLADGKEAEARDGIGLLVDPIRYAKKKCGTCHGRGVMTLVNHIGAARAQQLIKENPANEAFINEREPGKFYERVATMCTCAKRGYRKVYAQLADLLVKEKLATWSGFEHDAWGRHALVKLL